MRKDMRQMTQNEFSKSCYKLFLFMQKQLPRIDATT